MTKITNKVGSPFDIQTLNGPAVLPAFGSLEANFDSGYLNVLLMGGYIVEEAEVKKPEPDLSALQSASRELSGKDSDKRRSDKRLTEEISKIKKV